MMKKVVAGVAVVVAGAVTVPTVFAKGGPPKASFSVLKTARAAQTDTLPPLTGRLAGLVVPGSARFVGESEGLGKAYIARGYDGRTCFLTADDFGVGGGCIEQASLTNDATYVGTRVGDDVALLVPVPDAYDEVTVAGKTIEAKDNVVLTTVPKADTEIEISGDAGSLTTDAELGSDK